MMKVIVTGTYEEMSLTAAEAVRERVLSSPRCVLGLATGSTPLGMYAKLIEMYQRGEVSFKDIRSVNLDEYYPISPSARCSYRYYMDTNFFNHIDIDKANTHFPDAENEDSEKASTEYEKLISSLGKIELQILGIGRNGHIGFNEPGSFLYPLTHMARLSESTVRANSRFFSSPADVPRFSLTMGMKTILSASGIILLASGKEKREAVRRTLSSVIDTSCPSTLLCLHDDVTLIVTRDALE